MISYALVLLLTPAAVLLSRWIGSRFSLPFLAAIAGYFPFLIEAQTTLLHGFLLLLWWTVVLSATILWFSYRKPENWKAVIWRSEDYTRSMFRWIETAELPEGHAGKVVLFHLKQTLMFCAVALISANFFGLMLGAALLNYMNFYVASFLRQSMSPFKALWMAWNPWSVIRVVSFLYLGIVVSTPTLWLLIGVPWKLSLSLFTPGIAGILADIVLKITMSKQWSGRLREIIAPAR